MSLSAFSNLTREEREKLPSDDFADAARLLFPILDQSDVIRAAGLVEMLPDGANLKARIIEIAGRKNLSLPENWKSEVIHSEFSDSDLKADSDFVAFASEDLDFAEPTADGEYVIRVGKVFTAGFYPDKKFDITPEEMLEAVRDFEPVEVDIEHMPTIFDGKLGSLDSIKLADNGWDLIGATRIPKWLNDVIGTEAVKVSATWDRTTKKLKKLALVRNPRVADAALMAAFAANEINQYEANGKSESEIINHKTELLRSFSELLGIVPDQTYTGQYLMQSIHDRTADAGAVCSPQNEGEAVDDGEFVSRTEADAIQQIHDLAVSAGAKCEFVDVQDDTEPSASYSKKEATDLLPDAASSSDSTVKEKKSMKLKFKDLLSFFNSEVEVPVNEFSQEESSEEKAVAQSKEAEILPEIVAEPVEEATKVDEQAIAVEPVASKDPVAENSTEVEDELKARLAETEARLAALEAEKIEAESKVAEYKSTIAEQSMTQAEKDACAFAEAEIIASRAFPAERENLIALFKQAAEDDAALSTEVKFSAGGAVVTGSRVDALKALYNVRKPHQFTSEEVINLNAGILKVENDSKNYTDDIEKALAYAEKRNKAQHKLKKK